jgi:hypothetical protein
MPYVYSTATAGCKYTFCQKVNIGDRTTKRVKKIIHIKGGANVAAAPHKSIIDPNGHPIHTPKSVCTQVSDADLELLMSKKSFQRHIKAGFIKVDKKQSTEQAAKSLEHRDKSAPLTPQDLKGKGTVKTNKKGQPVDIELNEIVVPN